MIDSSRVYSPIIDNHLVDRVVSVADAEYLEYAVLLEAYGGVEYGIVCQFFFGSHK